MNCPKCNAANNPDARFCGSCGYDLQAAPQQNINEEVEEILEVDETSVEQPVMEQPQPVEQINSPIVMQEQVPAEQQPVEQQEQPAPEPAPVEELLD